MSRKTTKIARDRADEQLRQRKARDRSLALVLVGTALFLPPVANVFDLEASIGGLPVVMVYIFVVWALLIVGALFMSRRLKDSSELESGPEPGRREAEGRGTGA